MYVKNMMFYGFITGLLIFLTPFIFPSLFIVGIVTQKLATSSKQYWINSILIILSASLILFTINLIGFNLFFLENYIDIISVFNSLEILLFILLSIYLIGFFDLKNNLKMVFGMFISLTLGVKLALNILVTSAPFLGSLLLGSDDGESKLFDFMNGEVIAICFVLIVLLLVSRLIANKFKDKSWTENVPKLLGVYLLFIQIMAIIKAFNA